MLKITVTDTPEGQKWILYGQLAGAFVAELRSSWMNTFDSRQGRPCVVDLDGVTFIDEDGEKALSDMIRQGARPVASGVYTRQLVEELRSRDKRRLCKFLGRFF